MSLWVLLQNYHGLGIIRFKGIIFLLKILWNMSTVRRAGPWARLTTVHQFH
jgi:hypothetical protein